MYRNKTVLLRGFKTFSYAQVQLMYVYMYLYSKGMLEMKLLFLLYSLFFVMIYVWLALTPCLFQVLHEHIPHTYVLLHVVECFQLISHIKIEVCLHL